ncbi:inactive rhomboid protein 1-like isoform X1 [Lampetra planeri]
MADSLGANVSNLQKKKPSWLTLKIPATQADAAPATLQEPGSGQPSSTRPVYRWSVSMPVESHGPPTGTEMGKPSFQRQGSVAQSIRRFTFSKNPPRNRVQSVLERGQFANRRVAPHPKRASTRSRDMVRGTAEWFGVGRDCEAEQQRWQRRTRRHCSLHLGKLKPQYLREMEMPSQDTISQASNETPQPFYLGMQRIYDPLARGRAYRATDDFYDGVSVPRTPITPGAASISSFTSSVVGRSYVRRKRQSVAKMSIRAATALVKRRSIREGTLRLGPMQRCSFVPTSFMDDDTLEHVEELDTSFFNREAAVPEETSAYLDEVFESIPEAAVSAEDEEEEEEASPPRPEPPDLSGMPLQRDALEMAHCLLPERGWRKPSPGGTTAQQQQQQATAAGTRVPLRQEVVSTCVQRRRGKRIPRLVHELAFVREKRPYGLGMVGRLTNRTYRKRIDSVTKQRLEELDDHRPYFTYWITFVHILITILAVCIYGIAPVGFVQHETSGTILTHKGIYDSATYLQHENFWIGPNSESLIHLGAKFSPCMRQDMQVFNLIKRAQATERESGCCVRNDGSGCVQTSRKDCSESLSTWIKWPENDSPSLGEVARTSGAVCGQDPRICEEPASVPPHEWPDNITKWPICTKVALGNFTSFAHMDCDVTGHPCCIGTKGRCEITSREYCDFMNGYFHEKAALCSQVYCMHDVCGLLPFLNPEVPDQFYRLWLSLFLHAGILHCLLSVCFQMTVLRDLEKLAGWLRISIIYLLSGIAGNLASAIFLPYRAEVGPAGSQFGILACLFVELLQSWQVLARPWRALAKLLGIVLFLFAFGMLPWVDNFAHFFGFLSGLMLSFAFLPYVTFGRLDKCRKRLQIMASSLVFVGLSAALVVWFYVYPITCSWCEYLTCIPFTEEFCEKYDLDPNLHGV